jgi:hypothetical protein
MQMKRRAKAGWNPGLPVGMGLFGLATGLAGIGCDRPDPAPMTVEGPHALQRADELRMALREAQNAWSTGKKAEAQARVQSAYRTWFEPLEPVLRHEDPLATLRLEFEFGALAQRMGTQGDPVELNDAVMALVDGMDGLVQKLPAPPPEALEGVNPASEALPVAVEVEAPKREFTTYGDAKD